MGWHNDEVQDAVALAEIELCTELIIAASRSDGRMSAEEVDAVLGVVDLSALSHSRAS